MCSGVILTYPLKENYYEDVETRTVDSDADICGNARWLPGRIRFAVNQ